ncbi:MAG: transketolase [Candidatus Pacebacteria bacterium]|jgi:transketolase|nr:transketolase [Candidatus Paceibacterota bacterium]MBT3511566.1 transketolase [Candidatus Paceibacterota bacterium]MBT4004964.1 transketolase [Candidatus Paceibacterota bacterium]MBT4358740.1 transketolase [Candidatus Paceibacterota bacterium]MBT6898510.1 transketolase [Candidatus Paceibacterota bacterium]
MDHLPEIAKLLRYYCLVSTSAAGSGHLTSSLSAVELMTVLYFGGFLKYDLKNPDHPDNDRVIFSKGHAAPLFYSLYAVAGKLTEADLKTLRHIDSPLEGHPSIRFPYTEVATGSLGQGLSVGVGLAINAKYLDSSTYKTYVLLGDSEMAEGQVWEAMQLASYYKLNNLVGIIDVNRLGQRGETMTGHDVSDYAYKARAFGWETIVIDGHNLTEVAKAYQKASLVKDVPVMIIAKTIKGKGLSFLEDQDNWHGKALSQDHLQKALIELGDVNVSLKENILLPKEIGLKKSQSNEIKLDKFLAKPVKKHLATRKAYGNAITKLGAKNQKIVVLDAEMGNSTFANIFAAAFPDRFFEMFIAEQNMISVAVGLSRMGKIPFISTFASFLTRAFDQIRMAQYSKANIKLIGSHAGVSIGQDGPSQMGLEDISMFRSIRDSVVLYPSDAVSTEKLVQQMTNHKGISYLRTTRIDTPIIYKLDEEFKIGGSKVIYQSKKDVATVIAAGITLHEAMKAYRQLRKNKINIRVIDLYSIKPLDIETLMKSAQETKALVTAEDHYQFGGIGEAVKAALVNQNTPVHSLYVDQQPRSGQPAELLALEKIDAAAIVEKVRSLI